VHITQAPDEQMGLEIYVFRHSVLLVQTTHAPDEVQNGFAEFAV
jgi:hypothetical protein